MVTQEICECGNRKWFVFCFADHEVDKKGYQSQEHEFFSVCTECGIYMDYDDLFYNHQAKK